MTAVNVNGVTDPKLVSDARSANVIAAPSPAQFSSTEAS